MGVVGRTTVAKLGTVVWNLAQGRQRCEIHLHILATVTACVCVARLAAKSVK